jgi:hypothetical protein
MKAKTIMTLVMSITLGLVVVQITTATPTVATVTTCPVEVVALDTALDNLQAQLSVGINYNSYQVALTKVALAYRREVHVVNSLSSACLNVGVHEEKAYNNLIVANNIWRNCVQSGTLTSCTDGSVGAKVQTRWGMATTQINAADAAL